MRSQGRILKVDLSSLLYVSLGFPRNVLEDRFFYALLVKSTSSSPIQPPKWSLFLKNFGNLILLHLLIASQPLAPMTFVIFVIFLLVAWNSCLEAPVLSSAQWSWFSSGFLKTSVVLLMLLKFTPNCQAQLRVSGYGPGCWICGCRCHRFCQFQKHSFYSQAPPRIQHHCCCLMWRLLPHPCCCFLNSVGDIHAPYDGLIEQ